MTALSIGNVGKRQEAATGGYGGDGHATKGCCDANPNHKPRSHDTSRIAWAKLMARVGEEFPLECPNCGGDFVPRPVRPNTNWSDDNYLGAYPASTEVKHRPVNLTEHARLVAKLRNVPPGAR